MKRLAVVVATMARADYFEAACLRRVQVERARLQWGDSIVLEPCRGLDWHGNSGAMKKRGKRKRPQIKGRRKNGKAGAS